MFRYLPIRSVTGREILDSRGNPTVEVEVAVGEGILGLEGHMGRAQVPSGASTGKFEALEKRDQEVRYLGQGVRKAVEAVNTVLADAVVGENALEQERIDISCARQTEPKRKKTSGKRHSRCLTCCGARGGNALHLPLYQYLGGCHTSRMPVPMMNILNGGRHADNTVDLQEFMIMPCGAPSFREGLSMCAEIYHTLKQLLKEKGYSTSVGDEGGFAPDLKDSEEALQLIVNAVQKAGYAPGNDVMIAIDAAASELYEESRNVYYFPGESRQCGKTVFRDTAEMVAYYEELIEKYPIVSIEDGLCEDDFEGWKQMTEALGNRVQLVGDDLFVTNVRRLSCGIALGTANAVLIKVNQIGTLSEALDAVEMAQRAGYRAVISHRSGETEDDFLADLAVATGAGQIKTGAPCRSERNAKYNELLRIEERLGEEAKYRNPFPQKGTGVREW